MLNSEVLAAQDAAYAQLARDLHDNLGSQFAVIRLSLLELRAVADELHAPELSGARSRLLKASEIGLKCCGVAYDFGLSLADGRLFPVDDARQVLQRTVELFGFSKPELKVSLSENIDFFRLLPSDGLTHLTLLVREAMTNAFKYSGATLLQVRASVASGELAVRIHDDGCGFAEGTITGSGSGSGIGLRSMRFRAEALGAKFSIQSPPEGGCLVEVLVPLAEKFSCLDIPE